MSEKKKEDFVGKIFARPTNESLDPWIEHWTKSKSTKLIVILFQSFIKLWNSFHCFSSISNIYSMITSFSFAVHFSPSLTVYTIELLSSFERRMHFFRQLCIQSAVCVCLAFHSNKKIWIWNEIKFALIFSIFFEFDPLFWMLIPWLAFYGNHFRNFKFATFSFHQIWSEFFNRNSEMLTNWSLTQLHYMKVMPITFRFELIKCTNGTDFLFLRSLTVLPNRHFEWRYFAHKQTNEIWRMKKQFGMAEKKILKILFVVIGS